MDTKETNKVFLFMALFSFGLFFSLVSFSNIAQATIKVDIEDTYVVVPLGEPKTLQASCSHCDAGFCFFWPVCPDDFTWTWTIWPPGNEPNAEYTFENSNTPNPVFTANTKGVYYVLATVCNDNNECGDSIYARINVYDPRWWFILSDKYPFVIYESPRYPSDVECQIDSDGNGLADATERKIAQNFAPKLLFDAAEKWYSLGPDEPRVIFNIALNAINEDENKFQLLIRYGMVWSWDGGFVNDDTPFFCEDAHPGDTQNITVTAWLSKIPGKAQWIVELESISGFTDAVTHYATSVPFMYRDGTHPHVYPTAGKHHFRVSPGEYEYQVDSDGFCPWDACFCSENALGNYAIHIPVIEQVPHFPSATLARSGPQSGPPLIEDASSGMAEWANACHLLKGDHNLVTSRLRHADISDWTYPNCIDVKSCDYLSYFPGQQIWSSTEPLFPGWVPKITDLKFRDAADGIWSTVSGGFDEDIDKDTVPFWLDPCPVSKDNIDSDEDGLCDPIDVCPNDPNDDGDGDTFCDVVVMNQLPVARCVDVTVDADDNCQGSASIDNGSYDPDRDPINLEQAPSGPYPLGQNSVTLTVTDDKGEADQCSATVIVVDQEEPEITCLSPEEALCGASVEFDIIATDNCTEDPLITCVPSSGSIFSLGSTSVSCTVIDNSGNSSYCDFTVTIDIKEPMRVKQGILGTLRSFISHGDNETDQRIEKAINHLQKSLDSLYWNTDSTLGDKGKKVFDEEKKVCKELMKIHDGQDELLAAVPKVIGCLVEADKILAQKLIYETLEAGGDQKEIDKALKEMDKAQEESVKGKYDKAIEHYKKAWEHAQKALKKVR